MIAINHTVSGLSLQLDPASQLTVEQAAGWLAGDELPGAFSYPISFPLSPQNQQFLGYGYFPAAAVPVHNIPVRVHLDGMLYRNCTLSYRITEGKGDGYLKIDSGEVYDKLKSLSLLDALSTPVSLGDALGVTLDARMNTIAGLPPGASPFTFFPIRNELMLETELDTGVVPYTRQAYVNVWTRTGFKIDSGSTASTRGFLVVPQFYLAWVLTRIFEGIGYRIAGDWIGSPEVQRLTIFNQTAMAITTPGLAGGVSNLLHGHAITPGMHLPDMSVSDFLKAIRQRFGLTFTFNANEKTASIRRFDSVVSRTKPQNLTSFQLTGYSIDAPDLTGFTIYDYLDEQDELNKDPKTGAIIKPAPLVIGRGATEVQLKCGTTQLIYDTSPLATGARWLVPTVRQPGNVLDSYYAKSDRALQLDPGETVPKRKYNVGLKLLSYRGMTQDSAGNTYPLATNDTRNGRQEVVGSESCSLIGPGGIWPTVLRNYYYFRDNTRKVLAPALLPVARVASLRLDEQAQLSLGSSALVSFLINRLQAQAPGGSNKLFTKLELLTLPAGLELSPDVTAPPVWVELIQTKTTANSSLPGSGGTRLGTAMKIEVRIWNSRQKTAAALATSLVINLRRKTTKTTNTALAADYSETIVAYVVSGSSAVLEPALLSYTDLSPGFTTETLTIDCLLDPGTGYNII